MISSLRMHRPRRNTEDQGAVCPAPISPRDQDAMSYASPAMGGGSAFANLGSSFETDSHVYAVERSGELFFIVVYSYFHLERVKGAISF